MPACPSELPRSLPFSAVQHFEWECVTRQGQSQPRSHTGCKHIEGLIPGKDSTAWRIRLLERLLFRKDAHKGRMRTLEGLAGFRPLEDRALRRTRLLACTQGHGRRQEAAAARLEAQSGSPGSVHLVLSRRVPRERARRAARQQARQRAVVGRRRAGRAVLGGQRRVAVEPAARPLRL